MQKKKKKVEIVYNICTKQFLQQQNEHGKPLLSSFNTAVEIAKKTPPSSGGVLEMEMIMLMWLRELMDLIVIVVVVVRLL